MTSCGKEAESDYRSHARKVQTQRGEETEREGRETRASMFVIVCTLQLQYYACLEEARFCQVG